MPSFKGSAGKPLLFNEKTGNLVAKASVTPRKVTSSGVAVKKSPTFNITGSLCRNPSSPPLEDVEDPKPSKIFSPCANKIENKLVKKLKLKQVSPPPKP